MKTSVQDRHSLFLLVSVVGFFVLAPFVEHARIGQPLLLVLFFTTLFAATLELSDQRVLLWIAVPLVLCTLLVHISAHIYATVRPLLIASHVLSTASFGLVSVGLFAYLGRPGAITRGRIYGSASLYLILGVFWFSVYNLLETVHPGSFVQMVPVQGSNVHRGTLLYFSLVTLTTLGYGDVLPVSEPARAFAALEGASGVLYIAITVARLVAAYKSSDDSPG